MIPISYGLRFRHAMCCACSFFSFPKLIGVSTRRCVSSLVRIVPSSSLWASFWTRLVACVVVWGWLFRSIWCPFLALGLRIPPQAIWYNTGFATDSFIPGPFVLFLSLLVSQIVIWAMLWWFGGGFFGPFGVHFSPWGSEFHRMLARIRQASRPA